MIMYYILYNFVFQIDSVAIESYSSSMSKLKKHHHLKKSRLNYDAFIKLSYICYCDMYFYLVSTIVLFKCCLYMFSVIHTAIVFSTFLNYLSIHLT